MNNQRRDPRVGMIVALGVLLAALWGVITYGVYREAQEEMNYDVRVRPGVVNYGTRSTASVPMVTMSPRRLSAPMVSAGAVRAYAHHGHATMPKASAGTGYRIHTTSSATVHSIGSGGGNGGGISGGGIMGGGSSSSSSAGVSYGSVSVAMPVLAMATSVRSSYAASTVSSPQETASGMVASSPVASSPKFGRGIRRSPSGEGSEEGKEWTDEDGSWYWDGEEWVEYTEGTTKIEGDKTYVYRGGKWELLSNQTDPENPTPLGDMPWLWMILLLAIYMWVRSSRSLSKRKE
jgi:hypothetical protein